jgi:hypothetical protein
MLSKRAAKEYAYNLVMDGKVCFHQLNEEERHTLSGMLLEKTAMIHAYEYVSDADSKCELPYMLGKYMETKCSQLGANILEFMCNNAANAMSHQIDELLKEQETEYKFNQEAGGL